MNLSTIILAAGKGSRMKSSLPKVMHKVACKPLIGHIITMLHNINIKENIAVIGPGMQNLDSYIKFQNSDIKSIIQEERLGTGHAVKVGLKAIEHNSNILVLYGDTPFIESHTISKMYDLLQKEKNNALVILGFTAKDPAKYGRVIINNKDELEDIVEYLDCNEEQKRINICNSGVMLIRRDYVNKLLEKIRPDNIKKEYYLTDLIKIARNDNLICRYITIDEFEAVAINSREELAKAEEIIQRRLRKKIIENGVTLIDQNTVYFASDTIIENDVIIYPNVFFGPSVEIRSGTTIKSFSHIEGATIGKNSSIGPFARIRPGSNLANDVKIGNFVELKNATIKTEAKINHLSYIGDASIGKNSNIGAGTITCNYDGFNKYKTTIANNVFIGSNTALVAPIHIDEGAIIAAGSVITKDIAQNDLVIARTKQINLEGKAVAFRNKNKKSKNESKPAL